MKGFILMKMSVAKVATISLLLTIVFAGCDYSYIDGIEQIEEYTYKPVFAVPLIDSKIGIGDLIDLDDLSVIEVDQNELISLVYAGNIFSAKASEIFTVPKQDQIITINNIIPAGSGSTTLPPQLYVYKIAFEGEEILSFISFLAANLNIVALAPQLVADGYRVSASFRIPGSTSPGGGPITGVVTTGSPTNINLAGCSIETGNLGNFFNIEYTITVSGNGTPTNAPYTLRLDHSVTNIRYNLFRGYIDKINFPIGETDVPLTVFQNISDGKIVFNEPSINFDITNTFGLPIDISQNDFYATMSNDSRVPITGSGVDRPWPLQYPVNPTDAGVVTRQRLTNQNTNLFSVTGQAPREIHYNLRGLTNPGTFTQANNWVKHDSEVSIKMEVRLPLHGRIDFLNFKDTFEIDSDFLPEEIDWLEMRLRFENGFPLGVELKLVLYNELNQPIDTLFSKYNPFMKPATVNALTGLVTQPSITEIKEMVDQQTAQNLKKASKIMAHYTLKTSQSQDQVAVKILESYKLGLGIGVRIKGKAVINSLSGN